MTSKVMEANAGIHSLGMAVAVSTYLSNVIAFLKDASQPVTSWRLYGKTVSAPYIKLSDKGINADSIYTERYLSLPSANPGGYMNASIHNMTGFHNVNFLLAHGSGDDNVHFANSAHLLDMLTAAKVRDFRFRMFTDRFVYCSSLSNSLKFTTLLFLSTQRS